MRRLFAGISLFMAIACQARAQASDTVQMAAIRAERSTIARYWLAAAEQIPDSLYAYRPVAQVRSVGERGTTTFLRR